MIREQLPRATILTFWHIPWPNPESFGICPWRREILEGMLGSTILGFHTRFHCKNFIETVDRFLEARIEHEHSTISFKSEETLVESYPISIEWPSEHGARLLAAGGRVPAPRVRAAGAAGRHLPRRRRRPLRLHEGHPRAAARGRAAARKAPGMDRPVRRSSRSPRRRAASLEEYRPFQERIARVTERINERFGTARLPAGAPARRAPRARRGHRAVPRRRHLRRDQPARRHEPGLQGVRRRARRRAGRADPQPLRRRGARDDRSADRQPVPRRGDRRRAASRGDDAARRAARAHGQPAHDRAREQRLPLGRAHAEPMPAARACASASRRAFEAPPGTDDMRHLFTPEGEAALAATMARRPLLAFDFDGTLAPIVARPDDARVPAAVEHRLERLAPRAAARDRQRTPGRRCPHRGCPSRRTTSSATTAPRIPGSRRTASTSPLDGMRDRSPRRTRSRCGKPA